ncbi:Atu1372/SO_1960 family protein [Actinomadura sp. WMMB 499]|uniref:Rid family hydrolase n=1 Tax=Actinomadura sp. WMMB 499 TaxID=1219491 RepID=UPI001245E2FF|nr:Atu1372/SO_1960 family protein [Actinomadura sp. WMMB 499]QFG25023.1 RidA family protein [Actinomadura sp. WMMB 499]
MSAESPAGLPAPPRPQGDYVPAVVAPYVPGLVLVATAGMTPRRDGVLTVTGLVGADVGLAAARDAAGLAARNAVAAVAAALGGRGDATAVRTWLRMTVYVACADGVTELSAVADGASAALAAATPDAAPPARSAVGVRALPGGAPVEVELTALAAVPARDAVPDPPAEHAPAELEDHRA